MAISIYSFYNNVGIGNKELKAYYDIIQLNEDKIHGKLRKSDIRKIRKQVGKESLTDTELVKELVKEMRELKELVKMLDEKIRNSLDYQEQIVNEYNVKFVQDLEKTILKERMEYEHYIRQYMPIDILKFERFENEYTKIRTMKLPFENISESEIVQRLGDYQRKYHSLENDVRDLERRNQRAGDILDKPGKENYLINMTLLIISRDELKTIEPKKKACQ